MNEEKREQQMSTADVVGVAEKQTENKPAAEERPEEIEITVTAEEFVPLPLFDEGEAEDFRTRWQDIQAGFVDDPRNSVAKADELVANVIKSIEETFATERSSLEDQWSQGNEASTEDLRIALKRYRSFFDQLITLQS
jgi:hypothetical protein